MDNCTKQSQGVFQGCKYFSFCPALLGGLEVQMNQALGGEGVSKLYHQKFREVNAQLSKKQVLCVMLNSQCYRNELKVDLLTAFLVFSLNRVSICGFVS